jgi:hypothetical protein
MQAASGHHIRVYERAQPRTLDGSKLLGFVLRVHFGRGKHHANQKGYGHYSK